MNKPIVSTITNHKNYYYVSKEQLRKHGITKAVFFAILLDFQQSPKDREDKYFYLTIREIASMSEMSLFQIKSCIKYWKKQGSLDSVFLMSPEANICYKINQKMGGY